MSLLGPLLGPLLGLPCRAAIPSTTFKQPQAKQWLAGQVSPCKRLSACDLRH